MLLFNIRTIVVIHLHQRFQNILCCCLTARKQLAKIQKKQISKHPMLLFNCVAVSATSRCSAISKHPMLLFNPSNWRMMQHIRTISKHPMLLFNPWGVYIFSYAIKFQNILCCCLTIARRKKQDVLHNISKHPMLLFNQRGNQTPFYFFDYFKTSYVVV